MSDKFRLAEVHRWMFDEALPLWCGAGQDAPGLGFHEQLSLDGKPVTGVPKRMRVQARQVYTFCHAAELGWNGPGLEAAKNGIDFIVSHGWLPTGGWAIQLGPKGEQNDTSLHAYEQAFVLFAFGWYYRLTKDRAILAQVHRTLDVMDTQLANPGGLGFLTQVPGGDHLQQNPHMHFLEAMLVLYQATGEQRFLDEAHKVLEIQRKHLFQSDKGVLLEFFTLDWQPMTGDKGRIVEPGHHFEWIWLLWQAKRILDDDLMDSVPEMFAFADRYGSDAEGLVYDSLRDDGVVLSPTHRTWVITEALKGYIAMAEFTAADHSVRIAQLVDILLDKYLNTQVRGLWTDQPTAVSKATFAPASTFYHIFLAFAELQRWARSIS